MTSTYTPGSVSSALFSKNKKKVKNEERKALASLFGQTKHPPKVLQKVDLNEAQVNKKAVKRKKETNDSNSPTTDVNTENPRKKKKKVNKKAEKRKKEENISSASADVSTDTPRKKKKKIAKDSSNGSIISKQTSQENEFPYKHESLLKAKKDSKPKQGSNKKKITNAERKKQDELDEKRPRRNRKRDKTADKRTIFVGNCPLSADKKVLKRLFQEHGDIETIRIRCAPAADPNLPRRAIVITKNFHEKGKSFNSYIVFKEEQSAKKALEKNGFVLDENHLRVDLASGSDKVEKKKSIFIGNLAFDITEEEIRGHVEDCGAIANIRIVRDRQTSIGKGFCFVEFESKDSVGLALKLNGMELQGRKLRISSCLSKAKQAKIAPKSKNKEKSTDDEKDKKKMSFAPSNLKTTMSKFNETLKAKKERRLKKVKKKTHSKKDDQITKILGEAPVLPKISKKEKKVNEKKNSKGGKQKSRGDSGSFKGKRLNQPKKEFKGKHKIFD